jgi:hypothetical protein
MQGMFKSRGGTYACVFQLYLYASEYMHDIAGQVHVCANQAAFVSDVQHHAPRCNAKPKKLALVEKVY